MKIRREDINFLYFLYRFRCLSIKQIHEYFYTASDYYKDRIVPMIENKLVDLANVNGEYVLSIRQEGINLFQSYLNIPNEIYNAETGKNEKTTLRMKDVVVEEKFMNHQISLNEFVLEFRRKFGEIEYYDEKYLSGMKIIRPDGLIRIGKLDLFLEQDMGTESSKQLTDKWNRYRRYLSTQFNDGRKIVVLFILKCQNIDARKALVRRTILDSFGQMNCSDFDIYIGNKEEMLKASFDRIIPGDKERTKELALMLKPHNFRISDGSKLKAKLGTVYRYYIGSFDKQNRLVVYNPNKGRMPKLAEFLGDIYDYNPVSVLNKIYYHNKNAHNFDIAYSPRANLRIIGYIVVTKNINELYKHLTECELIGFKGVYFTTPERLKKMKFQQAIFSFTKNGDIMTCPDYYFEPTIKEGNIKKYGSNGLPLHN